jgi:UDPglucose 6-dehydrogenase
MRISVIGSGYVGLVTAAGLSETGHHVRCVDVDDRRVAMLREGKMPFFEPGLADLVARNVRAKRLSFEASIDDEYATSDVYFIAVGTPSGADARADLSAVFRAAETVAAVARKPALLVLKSTVPVGTADAVEARIAGIGQGLLRVGSNPEFLKEGAALEDFFRPDRVVIGVSDAETERALRELYRPLQLSGERVLVMDRRSAELAKYAANAMLAVRISFMNELSRLCDAGDADITAIRRALGADARIGKQYLYAGPGYGGSCFPKDVQALAAFAHDFGVELGLVEATARANQRQREYVYQRLKSFFPEGLGGKTIAIWGLAFKPETDDVRESPAGALVKHILADGGVVRGHDPEAAANFARTYAPDATFHDSELDALDGADALVLMTEWRHLRNPDFDEVRRRMARPNILDARNVWTSFELRDHGFDYRGIGTKAGRA